MKSGISHLVITPTEIIVFYKGRGRVKPYSVKFERSGKSLKKYKKEIEKYLRKMERGYTNGTRKLVRIG